ncbi:MAG: hypothetical protein ACOZCE_13340 [Spirochaetota bacterium]|jgi:hypothetical protein
MAVHHRWVCGFLMLFLIAGCTKDVPRSSESVSKRPAPVQVFLQTDTTSPVWYEVAQESLGLISGPADSQVLPFAPWTIAPRLIGFVVTGSTAIGGLNRNGFLVFEESAEGNLALYRIAGGEAVSSCSSMTMVLLPPSELELESSLPMPALLVAWDPYFADLTSVTASAVSSVTAPAVASETSVSPVTPLPAEPLVTLDLRDFSVRSYRPRAFGPAGTNVEALDRGADGAWYIKAAVLDDTSQGGQPEQGGEARQAGQGGQTSQGGQSGRTSQAQHITGLKEYFAAQSLSNEPVSIGRGAYQTALQPQPFTSLPKMVQQLMRSFTDSQRKNHFPVLHLVRQDRPVQELFVADPGAKNVVPLSGGESEIIKFIGYADDSNAVVVLPDGRGVIRRSSGLAAFSLPQLPDGFVYTGIVMLPHWIIAGWEEQESFAVGSAGFLIVKL